MKKIAIVIEFKAGEIKEANFGMITSACQEKEEGDEIFALIPEGDPSQYQERLKMYGVTHVVDITAVGPWNPMGWSDAIIETMKRHGITTLFGLTTPSGRELLPRIAAKLDAPLVMDCIDVSPGSGIAKNYLYSGKTLATIEVKGEFQIYGIRPNVVAPSLLATPGKVDLISMDFGPLTNGESFGNADEKGPEKKEHESFIRLVERRPGDASAKDLQEADVLIAGGRGMQSGENFALIQECADVMGADLAASRVAVDMGWAPYPMQVGQTGEKVSPKVYIACGISGSVQHFAGMKMSGMIIAINSNPNAAIMANCDYCIEGDLFEVIPALTKALKQQQQQ